MLILPVAGDTIKSANEIPLRVLSYTNYNSKGPAVLCEGVDSEIITVFFKDLISLNDIDVKLVKNAEAFNILETDGYIQRKVELPQPKSKIVVGGYDYKIQRLNLHVRNQISRGLIFDCENISTGGIEEILLHQITRVDRSLSSQAQLVKYYRDYTSKGSSSEATNK